MILPLLEAPSRDAYLQHVDDICRRNPDRKDWFRGKRKPWIVAGLVATASKVDPMWRAYARKNTNLAESGHYEDYAGVGQSKTLVAVILQLKQHMLDKVQKLENSDNFGVWHTWQDRTPKRRLGKAYAKRDSKNRKQADKRQKDLSLPFNPRNPYDHPANAEHMSNASSSPPASLPDTPLAIRSRTQTSADAQLYAEHMLGQETDNAQDDDNPFADAEHMPEAQSPPAPTCDEGHSQEDTCPAHADPDLSFLFERPVSPARRVSPLPSISQVSQREIRSTYAHHIPGICPPRAAN